MRYDQLVLACGTNTNLDIAKGMANYALPLKTLGDAPFPRNRIISRLEQAALQPDVLHRRWLISFVVVGGGFDGLETAGELADFLDASLRYYKRIPPEDLGIVLLHSADRLLPELSVPGVEGVWAAGDCAGIVNAWDGKPCANLFFRPNDQEQILTADG